MAELVSGPEQDSHTAAVSVSCLTAFCWRLFLLIKLSVLCGYVRRFQKVRLDIIRCIKCCSLILASQLLKPRLRKNQLLNALWFAFLRGTPSLLTEYSSNLPVTIFLQVWPFCPSLCIFYRSLIKVVTGMNLVQMKFDVPWILCFRFWKTDWQ